MNMTKTAIVMKVWHEAEASRGPEEIASCLLEYCRNLSNKGVTKVVAYSDACGGQNRNYKLASMWMYITQTRYILQIDELHIHDISLHCNCRTYRDVGVIEKKSKQTKYLKHSV